MKQIEYTKIELIKAKVKNEIFCDDRIDFYEIWNCWIK